MSQVEQGKVCVHVSSHREQQSRTVNVASNSATLELALGTCPKVDRKSRQRAAYYLNKIPSLVTYICYSVYTVNFKNRIMRKYLFIDTIIIYCVNDLADSLVRK